MLVYRGSDGELMLCDGVTRAAKLCPGSVIPAELLGSLPYAVGHLPIVMEKLLRNLVPPYARQSPSACGETNAACTGAGMG